ncbi:PQQ-binding-like beta-propeller repeat protein [Streptomyces sp. G45]|uniref:outer membrane protein assembly factor BamB family protein n=1 Tax=Streptomyces sp. G45 TaxID=3406627 RepID=UPI003C2182DF
MTDGPSPSRFTESALAVERARRTRRARMLAGLAGLLALALCAGGWMVWAAGDDGSDAQDAKAVQQAPDEIRDTVETIPDSPAGSLVVDYREKQFDERFGRDATVAAPGTWATDKTFVRGVGRTLKGFTYGKFDEAWTTDLGGPICDTTRHVTADGRTAVLVQERPEKSEKPKEPEKSKKGDKGDKDKKDRKSKGKDKDKDKGKKRKGGKGGKDGKDGKDKGKKDKPSRPAPPAPETCEKLVFVDLDTGKKLWEAKLPDAKAAFAPNTNVTMTRGTVAVAWGQGSMGYDMASGKRLWGNARPSACGDAGFAGGRALLALRRCERGDDHTYRIQKVDPRTGEPQWTYKVSPGIQNVNLVSAEPAVIAVAAGDSGATDLITLDDRGAYQATIDLPKGRYEDDCFRMLYGTVETCDAIAVGRDQLFLATKAEGLEANWIVSFDLATGKTVRKFDSKGRAAMYPVRVSGDRLLAFRGSIDGVAPDAVVSLDPKTGKETPFMLFSVPDDAGIVEPGEADVVVERGRVFVAPRELSAEDSGPWKGAAFGAVGVEGS